MSKLTIKMYHKIYEGLAKVFDPELQKPITELGMVKSIFINLEYDAYIEIYLTISTCPKKKDIVDLIKKHINYVPEINIIKISLHIMNDRQRSQLRSLIIDKKKGHKIPSFCQSNSLTRVYAIASGKGGVGKSTITVNLASSMASRGLSVGILDADMHGHSIPRLLGISHKPTKIDSMILPPVAHKIKVISVSMFIDGNMPVVWRGPMLHRALQQFLVDVHWGDLDILLLDLPPGTGDIAVSVAQLIPKAEILIITTPQNAAAEVAERAGAIAIKTHQRIAGVIENMSGLSMSNGSVINIFGKGGGLKVAKSLTKLMNTEIPLIGNVPLDPELVKSGDSGVPIVLSSPNSSTSEILYNISKKLYIHKCSLVGMPLGLKIVND